MSRSCETSPFVDGHTDERRRLSSIFNGDIPGFAALEVGSVVANVNGNFRFLTEGIVVIGVIRGSARLSLLDDSEVSATWQEVEVPQGSRIILPDDYRAEADFAEETILAVAASRLRFLDEISDSVDCTVCAAMVGTFEAQQVKVAEMFQEARLGGHAHAYPESFGMAAGRALFRLSDRKAKKSRLKLIKPGETLTIPPGIAHAALVSADGILVGSTRERYVSAKENDIPHPRVKTPGWEEYVVA